MDFIPNVYCVLYLRNHGSKLIFREFSSIFRNIGIFTVHSIPGYDIRKLVYVCGKTVMKVYPYAYLFFVPFILINSFIILNVFVAVIVNGTYECVKQRRKTENKNSNKEEIESNGQENNFLTKNDFEERMSNLENQIIKLEKLLSESQKEKLYCSESSKTKDHP